MQCFSPMIFVTISHKLQRKRNHKEHTKFSKMIIKIIMAKNLEKSRDTWFYNGRYLMRATSKFICHADPKRRDIVEACAKVFEGDPAQTNKPPLFISESHLYSDNLDAPLAEAERLGRIFIKTLPQ
jgi:hypothetical protein